MMFKGSTMLRCSALRWGAVMAALLGGVPVAGNAATTSEAFAAAVAAEPLDEVVVTAHRVDESLWRANQALDAARENNLLPPLGASAYAMDAAVLDALPQGKNTPLDKLLLQTPGVSADSAVSNPDFHVRNEYANVQYRIDGIRLPDGVSALGPVLETGFIGKLELLDGVLPAQYGMRTAGVVDITTKTEFDRGGNVDLYGGSFGTVSPSVEYGGGAGGTQYFVTGRYLESDLGLDSATPGLVPLHDHTSQEKFFGYASTLLGADTRLTTFGGGFVGHFQIPDIVDAPLNENELDRFFFGVMALQTHRDSVDAQVSAYSRYASVHFVPDQSGDLAFNGVASNVVRESLLNGFEGDAAVRIGDVHTLRAGVTLDAESTRVQDLATVLPLDAVGEPLPEPLTLDDTTSKLGWAAGVYLQDEWRLRPDLVLNTGARFDVMNQFVAAHQVSPRIALLYTPSAATTLRVGVARYFTPPLQAQATPNNLALFQNTTQAAAIALDGPALPERATYYDLGVEHEVAEGLTLGADVYYKQSTDTLDDGQFGQAVVLDQYNYARGLSRGQEFKASFARGAFRVYANVSHEITLLKGVVSHQYLIGDPVLLAYLDDHYTYASDAQTVTASAGASYLMRGARVSIDAIEGSGLRAGFANEDHSPGYVQWNAAVGHTFDPWGDQKSLTLRVSAVNLFDRQYVLRSGTGVGEFAPQYGPRRGVYAEFTQQF